MTIHDQGNQADSIRVSHEFNAPRTLVFRAFSDAAMLARWWGPAGFTMKVQYLDFRPGGHCLFQMENADTTMWARFVYGQIREPELIELTLSFSDENGGICKAPFFEAWPLEMMNVFRFSEEQGKTRVENHCYPVHASEAERAAFREQQRSVQDGLAAAMRVLEGLLAGTVL
ncbi:MAG: SRPBCC domain-containing protein [Chitinophagaceae bacterium]|nr:SRPBCC domain-containing protein [Chitinophagaceae bacterium]